MEVSNLVLAKTKGDDVMWIEKYRPAFLDEVAAQYDVIQTGMMVKQMVLENRLPHLLFYGPPGTGKTSTILSVAQHLYGHKFSNMILELNASDDRGISVVRQQIVDFASTKTIFSDNLKLIILDECDSMTKDAQFALRRVIEKYTKTTRFCLICNFVSKIIPALQSRCTKLRFSPISKDFIIKRLREISTIESVKLGDGALTSLAKLSNGDLRRSLNILQSAHMASDIVSEATIYNCTGHPLPSDMDNIMTCLFNEKFKVCFDRIFDIQQSKGIALLDILQELTERLFKIEMPNLVRINILDSMANLENNLMHSTSEKLQLAGLVAEFVYAREKMVEIKNVVKL